VKKEKIQIEIDIPSKSFNVKHASCPNGHSLIDESVKINGYPALKVKIICKGKTGFLFLDPVYGSYENVEKGITLRENDVSGFFCPECDISLLDPDETCSTCSSPMFILQLPHGSFVEGCTKKGCMFHKLKLVSGEQQMGRLFDDSSLDSFL